MKSKKVDITLSVGFFILTASILVISLIGMNALQKTIALFAQTHQRSVVSAAAAEQANGYLIALHHAMTDIALSGNAEQLENAIKDKSIYEKELDVFFSHEAATENPYYAGAKAAYAEWETVRQATLAYAQNDEFDKAAENVRTADYDYVNNISGKMDMLIGWEQAQQVEAYNTVTDKGQISYLQLLWMGIFTALLAVMVSVFIRGKQKDIEKKLLEEKEELRIILNSIGDGVISVDMDENVNKMNFAAEKYTGWTAQEAKGKPFGEVFHVYDALSGAKAKNPVEEVLRTHRACQMENYTVLTGKNGEKYYIADSAAPVKGSSGENIGVVLIFRDVTQQKQVQEQLEISESRLKRAQSIAHVGNWELNISTGTMWASKEAFLIYGIPYESSYLPYDMVKKMVVNEDRHRLDLALNRLINENEPYNMEFRLRRASDGQERWVHSIAVLECDETGRAQIILGTLQDITERKGGEREILFLSQNDGLTGIYNRAYFEKELERLNTEQALPLSYIIGDVNGLKLVNDTLGHTEGDKLLIGITKILRHCSREGDVIARIGGDEFCILMPNTTNETAQGICKAIYNDCAEYADTHGKDAFFQSISLGCATKNTKDQSIGAIMKSAEQIMYRRKMLQRKSIHSSIISSIKTTMFEKNHETEEHAERLIALSRALGEVLNLPEEKMNELELLSGLHDIGKMSLDDHVLNKPGKLTEEEWFEIRKHPEVGYRIAEATPDLVPIAEYILCHHERWDGTGYPQGMQGERIPLLSRIIAIVDAYDAMTQDRPYRKALSKEFAMDEILLNAGSQFDPELAEIFVRQVLLKMD